MIWPSAVAEATTRKMAALMRTELLMISKNSFLVMERVMNTSTNRA